MNYNYYAKQEYYAYLAGGVQAWDLLLPNNIDLKKGDTVKVIETYDNGDETGRATTGTIVFNGVDGIMTVNGNRDFYYINNLTTTNMFKLLRATVSQSDVDAPVLTILENTLGTTPTIIRDDVGLYSISTGLTITPSKCVCLIGSGYQPNDSIELSTHIGSADFGINSYNPVGTLSDDVLLNTAIDIKIYP
jgi:hypothetical protein